MTKHFYLLICFVIFVWFNGYAQAGNEGGNTDGQLLNWGFTFQYIATEYKILKKDTWREPIALEPGNGVTDPLYSISSPVSPGFGFGFVTKLRLGNNSDLRFTPALVFADRLIDYNYLDSSKFRQQKVQTTLVDFPLGIIIKSDRRKNFRAYMLGGAKYSIDIISKKKTDDSGNILLERFVKNKKNIIWYEVGVGCDLYFPYFIMSPEIKLSNSYSNVLKAEDHPYSQPLDKLFLRNVQFSLYFQ